MRLFHDGARQGMILVAAWAVLVSTTVAAEPSAEEVLNGVGIQHGLIVHVGATDGSLAEGLAKSESLLLQAIALDAATEAKIRQRFVQAGIHGQATAGRLSTAAALPLADQTASVVQWLSRIWTRARR